MNYTPELESRKPNGGASLTNEERAIPAGLAAMAPPPEPKPKPVGPSKWTVKDGKLVKRTPRERLDDEPSPSKCRIRRLKAKDARGAFVLLNKNLIHYPMLRSTSAWEERDGFHVCELHPDPKTGDPRLILSLPADFDHPRAPSRFDLDVLLRLDALHRQALAEAIHKRAMQAGRSAIDRHAVGREKWERHGKKSALIKRRIGFKKYWDRVEAERRAGIRTGKEDAPDYVPKNHPKHERDAGGRAYTLMQAKLKGGSLGEESYASMALDFAEKTPLRFRSLYALVKALGRDTNSKRNYVAVLDCLVLWSELGADFTSWKRRKQASREHHLRFLQADFDERGAIIIGFDKTWIEARGQYCARVALPLVLSSDAALNFSLWLGAFSGDTLDKTSRNFRSFCNTIGLTQEEPARLNFAFNGLLGQLSNHSERHGGRRYVVNQQGADRIRISVQ